MATPIPCAAIVFASVVMFAVGLPISFCTARYNINIDLLVGSAGFGYVGSTITSLTYNLRFVLLYFLLCFALDVAIMAQALYFELPLFWAIS